MLKEIIKTRTEKRIFRNTLVAFRSYLIKERRRLKTDTFKANEEEIKDRMAAFTLDLKYCRAVRVRYNKTEIIEGKPVGHPKRERERFCVEWVDDSSNEKKRKYFPYTAIVSVSEFDSSDFFDLNQIIPTINQINFNYNEFGASEPMIDYMKTNVHSVDDVNTILKKLVELKVSDQLTASQKPEREDAFFAAKNSRRLQHFDSIVFLYNGKETEGTYLSNLSTSEKYFLVQSDAIKTKNHRKYVPNWCFCRVIGSDLPQ